jgi:hypothetical protein
VVDAGPTRTAVMPAGAALDGTVTDDGLPGSGVTSTWAKASGPGTVTFADAAAVDTTATFSAAGTYTLSLTANDGALGASDTTTVTVTAPNPTATNSFSGSLSSSRQSVTHYFSSKPGTITVSVALTNTNGRTVTARVRSPGGSTLGQKSGTSGTITFTVTGTSTGTYRLVMSGTRGTYTASVTHPA